MKFLFIALALIAVCSAQSDDDWARFQQQYGKLYRSAAEVSSRRAIWENNWGKIKRHNEEFAKGLHTYTLGENQFADMTYEEFASERLGLSDKVKNQKFVEYHESERAVSQYVDLRNKGWISSIKDQGRCGGCWSFATVSAVETLYTRFQGVNNPDLSEQQMIDCSKGLLLGIIRRNNGCNGGQLECTYDDMARDGLQTEASYPYTASNGTCKYDKTKVVYKITGGVGIRTEQAIVDAVEAGNAVTVGIHVSDNFQLYKSGVYYGSSTENTASPNHAVVVVGYDLRNADGFYVVKNSWSPRWGEEGYFRLAFGGKHLSVQQMASYPKA